MALYQDKDTVDQIEWSLKNLMLLLKLYGIMLFHISALSSKICT